MAELVLGVGGAPAHADVLHRHQKQVCARLMGQFVAQPSHHRVGRHLAFGQGFERDVKTGGIALLHGSCHGPNRRLLPVALSP